MKFKRKLYMTHAAQWYGFKYGPHDLGIMPLNPAKPDTGYILLKGSQRYAYVAHLGDWIITYEDGKKSACKLHCFKTWYTPAGPVKKETHGSSILADSIKALSLAENGEFKEALEYIDKVIKVCPWDQAFYQKGNIYEMMEEYDEAIKFYDKAVEMTPGFDWPMKRKAAVLRKTGRYQELKEFYNKCVDERPKIRQRARERETKERELGYDTQYATEEYKMEKYEEILETIRKYIPKTQGENIIHPGFLNYSESGRKNVIHLGFRDYSEIAEKTYRKSPEQQRIRKDMFLKMGVILGICSAQLLAIFLYMTSSPAGTSAAVYITIGVVWSLWKLWKI